MSKIYEHSYGARLTVDLAKRFEDRLKKLRFQKSFVLRYMCVEFVNDNVKMDEDFLLFKSKYTTKDTEYSTITFHINDVLHEKITKKLSEIGMKKTDLIVYLIHLFADGKLRVKNELFGD